jgi:D-alanyl-lipoteichoic acid acyltransferase DltB (MBOAT superfamily)
MLFNSFEYLIFLPLVFCGYWFIFKKLQVQNIFIVAVSYIFYGWWDKTFLLLIAITTLCSYFSGVLIERIRVNKCKWGGVKWDKVLSLTNIILNLGILCVYKYFNFFADSLIAVFSAFGVHFDAVTVSLVLPVGISFYTFQALSYTIDVYRRKIEPTHDIAAFFAFISFFPQLVAGPIERSTNLLPQFLRPRNFDYAEAVTGMRQILWGMFKKIVIADNCAGLANLIFKNYSDANASLLLLGALFFTFQIYGDFSGYSDIAIGTARLFGIRLMKNFNLPYFSKNISEFWRRWHISLNTWFIDYVYIPLGGSRGGKKWLIVRNILIVFALSGLWHGANWTFVVWGMYNGILVALWTLFIKKPNSHRQSNSDLTLTSTYILNTIGTFGLIVIGWIFFRAETISQACEYILGMCNSGLFSMPNYGSVGIASTTLFCTIAWIFILQIIDWRQRKHDFGLDITNVKYRVLRWAIYLFFAMSMMVFAGQSEQFIYFQF